MEASVKVSKLTKEQRMEWKAHLDRDHEPYRSDCSICINAQATGYQHRRRRYPGMFALAVDLAGPFRTKGKDLDFDDYRYAMVAACRCPRSYVGAMELDPELYVPDTDTELPGDEDPMALDEEEKFPGFEEEHTEDDDEEQPPDDPSKVDDEVEELSKKMEHSTIYITRCLRRRTGPHVLQAAKEVLLQLRQIWAVCVNYTHRQGSRVQVPGLQKLGYRRETTS